MVAKTFDQGLDPRIPARGEGGAGNFSVTSIMATWPTRQSVPQAQQLVASGPAFH